MTPFLVEECHEDGNCTGRIVWADAINDETLPRTHALHAAVLDIAADALIINVDGVGCNSVADLHATYPFLVTGALERLADLAGAAAGMAQAEIAAAEALEAEQRAAETPPAPEE